MRVWDLSPRVRVSCRWVSAIYASSCRISVSILYLGPGSGFGSLDLLAGLNRNGVSIWVNHRDRGRNWTSIRIRILRRHRRCYGGSWLVRRCQRIQDDIVLL